MSQIVCASTPSKGARKADQKVQFVSFEGADAKATKQPRKPPEIPHRSSQNKKPSRKLHSASSLSNLPKENETKSLSQGTGSLERQHSRSSNSSRTSPVHRRRPGSFTRQKNSDATLVGLDIKQTQSLEKRQVKKATQDNETNIKFQSEPKESNSKRKHSLKLKSIDNRGLSSERSHQVTKSSQPILTQNGGNKACVCETRVSNHEQSRKDNEFQKYRRTLSRSPKRNFNKENNEEFVKENEKEIEKHKQNTYSNERQSRTRTHHQNQEESLPPSGKGNKLEYYWKFEKDVMWICNSSGVKRAGYLLFKCSYLEQSLKDSLPRKFGMTFKFSQADSKLIRILLEAHGFTEVNTTSNYFNLYWGNAHFSPNEIRQLQDWQKINHFPRSSELTRKDRLYMNIKRMQRQFGVKLFDFIPTSFVLPTEYREFCDTHLRERGTWIVKPVASSQGKGIYLVSQVDQVPPDETSLICRYLDTPLLVDGYKCDLRLYVAVTSLDPLVVYLYEEGLVRLATIKYQHGKNLWNPCIHLTNYSVNKFHSNYVQNEDPEVDDRGNKWSLSAFLRHLKSRGTDTGALMRGIEDVIIKSILSASYQMNTATNMFVPYSRNCFELYGFDILIDNQLKPWVLEVNLSPSLNMDQPLDLKIKSAMLADLFSLVGIQVCNPNEPRISSRPSIYRKLPNLRYSTESIERSQFGGRINSVMNGGLSPSLEELKIFRQLREEYERRGGWARIFPTPDSWAMYGSLQEYDSPLNLILHLHLYPNIPRNNRFYRVAPLKMTSVSSSGLASSLERLNCYERALPKGLSFLKNKFLWGAKRKEEKKACKDVMQVKASLVNALESGVTLSKYQARMAFSVYLQHVQRRLMIGCDQEKQTDLVYRFLRSASRTLHLPFNIQAPSRTLPQEARAVVISKQLGDFIQAYTKETHLYVDQAASASCSSLSSQCPPSSAPTPSDPSAHTPIHSSTVSLDFHKDHEANREDSSVKESAQASYVSPTGSPFPSSVSLLSVDSLPDSTCSAVSLPSIQTCSQSTALRQPSALSEGSFPPSVATSSAIRNPSRVPNESPSVAVIDASSSGERSRYFQSKLRRFRSNADTRVYSVDDESNLAKSNGSSVSRQDSSDQLSRKLSDQEDGIAMELYRAFLSSARESDLEEVLSLQTRIHNSAGVFLDPARRARSSTGTTPSSSSSVSSSCPRTPTASPQGSPRRSRKSPVHGDKGNQGLADEPVTNEPQSSEMKRSSSGSGIALSNAPSSSPCCLFGNILKASLKGTKVNFNP